MTTRHPAKERRSTGGRMPFADHLREARTRLLLSAAGVLVGSIAGWILYPLVFDQLIAPLAEIRTAEDRLVTVNFAGVVSALDMQLKVAIVLGVVLTSPWWLYQVWAFITPALTRRERRYTVAYLASAVPLFLAGGLFAWWLLPKAVGILISFTPQGATNLIDAQAYLTFVIRMVLAFGVAFLVPVFVVALNAVGVVSARHWLAGWRWAVLIAFLFAAIATPTTDAISMIALAIPISLLYMAAVGIAILHDRRTGRWAETRPPAKDHPKNAPLP